MNLENMSDNNWWKHDSEKVYTRTLHAMVDNDTKFHIQKHINICKQIS